ncbi:MAG: RNA-binding S4 domain-containing protein [Armatimonadetes bacterium]|nr:RNA-binding S4 domain-containing protein [Armatimonadota bacterium]
MSADRAVFALRNEFITLGQLIKALDLIDSGAEAKAYLAESSILINGENDTRRGRKIRPGDEVTLPDGSILEITAAN